MKQHIAYSRAANKTYQNCRFSYQDIIIMIKIITVLNLFANLSRSSIHTQTTCIPILLYEYHKKLLKLLIIVLIL